MCRYLAFLSGSFQAFLFLIHFPGFQKFEHNVLSIVFFFFFFFFKFCLRFFKPPASMASNFLKFRENLKHYFQITFLHFLPLELQLSYVKVLEIFPQITEYFSLCFILHNSVAISCSSLTFYFIFYYSYISLLNG